MWLAGELKPDHNTLWRFWAANQEAIGQLFELTMEMARELGLIGLALHAVDGTKIQACGSTHGRSFSASEAERLSEELQDRKKLEQWIDRAIANADEKRRENPSEKDAVLLKKCGLGYNAQTVVDDKAALIIEQGVVASKNDQEQLIPMLDRVQQRFGQTATETVADGGYNTQSALARAEEKQYSVIVGTAAREPKNSDEKPYHASRFTHEQERDVVICPQKRELTYERTVKRKATAVRVYRGRQCHDCPVRDLCTRDRRGRSIDLWPQHGTAVRQRKKREDPAKRRLYKRRLPLAERPFATIKTTLRFTRFKSRGIIKAAIEWKFICGIYNLTRLMALYPAIADLS